jgi:hypothetical protein
VGHPDRQDSGPIRPGQDIGPIRPGEVSVTPPDRDRVRVIGILPGGLPYGGTAGDTAAAKPPAC